MRSKLSVKLTSVIVSIMMVITVMPVITFAAETNSRFVSETHDVFKHTESTIAPGVEQYTNYAYAKDGKQMVYYVATADISRDDVIVQSSYKDAQCKSFGMEKLTNQMAAANAKYSNPNNEEFISEYYTTVVGTNGDFYNMTTGQPSGAFVMDGVMSSNKANNRPWFAVFADGTALCGANNADWDAAVKVHGAVQQAVGGSEVLVMNGRDITASYSTDRHSRTMVGVTADGKVVMAVLDGRQEPFSCGGTMHELAQIMLEAGCVQAINLDGGGSTTFAARPEGENEVKVINRPSDGSERSISSGLIIASTAVPSDKFDRATLALENEYVTPGSAVQVNATGVSTSGTAAEIPEGVTYTATLGTIDENGKFVSDGTVGDAVISMMYEGKVVGETTVHVVVPDKLVFNQEKMTVPFGKTVVLSMTATYGFNEVVMKPGDVDFALSDSSIGTINGFNFTAAEDGASSDIIAACSFNKDITAKAVVSLGKGSEVIFDFEDGTTNGFALSYSGYNYYLPKSDVYSVDKTTGKVHSGDHALALNIDYSNSLEAGYQMIALYFNGEDYYRENAKNLGMWIYIPDECVSLWARWNNVDIKAVNEDGSYVVGNLTGQTIDGSITGTTGYVYTFEESGWHYLSIDLSSAKGAAVRSGYYLMQFYISDRAGAADTGYLGLKDKDSGQYCNVNGNYTFYIDDITIDYSDAVDDRDAPVFKEMNYGTEAMADAVAIAKRSIPTIAYNTVDFAAKVSENTAKDNATGLDASTAKAYVDGNEVPCVYAGGVISMNDSTVLSNGQHTIKFSICDNQGNYASIIRQVNIESESNSTAPVKIVAKDPNAENVPFGSVQYIDIVANNIEKIQAVDMKIDLDNMSKWELDHIEAADGFKVEWSMENYDATENIATFTVTRDGNVTASGEAVLASVPVRMWALDEFTTVGSKVWDYAAFKAGEESWPIAINLIVDQGKVTFTDGSTDTFTGKNVRILSEMYGTYAYMNMTAEGKEYWKSWNGGHIHTETALPDKAATCTESGYTGRTYCEGCASVVDWGTEVPATGHSYDFKDGVLRCSTCDDIFNGVWTDGKSYIDGIVIADGWYDDSYYADGVMLTGVQKAPAADGSGEFYYDFGEDGVCAGKTKYTGLFMNNGCGYFSKVGELTSGWQSIVADDGESYFYYFDKSDYKMYTGIRTVDNLTYTFNDEGQMVRGAFRKDSSGTKYFVAGESWFRRFVTLEEGTYWLDVDGFVAYGNAHTVTTNVKDITWYHFDEETGLLTGLCSGLIDYRGEKYYCDENGKVFFGAIKIDDGIIYSATRGKLYVNTSCYIDSTTACKDCSLETGKYWCDENGYIVGNGFVDIEGVTYYFKDYQRAKGFTKIDDNYYMFNTGSGKMYKDATMWVGANDYGIEAGMHYFDAEGKMFIPNLESGIREIVSENGKLYFTIDGVKATNGLNELDGEYYYAKANGELAVNSTVWVDQKNGLIPEKGDWYSFDEEGKLVKTGFVEGGGYTYYYENSELALGFTKIGEDYYMFNAGSGKMYKDATMWVGANNYGVEEGMHYFDAEGKMFIPNLESGIRKIVSENGKLYFTIDGVKVTNGLNELDGEYYYAKANGELAVNSTVWVDQKNGLIPEKGNWYSFDEEGKLVKTGFVEGGGYTYYYENSELALGFTKIGEDYYMFNAGSGKMYKDATMWVGANNYGVEAGMHYFDADGKMSND